MPSIFANLFKKGKTDADKRKSINPLIRQNDDPTISWENLRVLGDGAFGKVYLAKQTRGPVHAALKQVPVDTLDDLEDCMVEIDVLTTCRHQNIVALLEAYLFDMKLWMYIEFCGGGAIDSLMQTLEKPLSEVQIRFVTREMCHGLDFLHSSNVIHRDLKAGNVLLTTEGQVKLADFGVSAKCSLDRQRRDSFVGTPYWMAPEVINCENFKDAPYDTKADIWSFGITVIEFAQMHPPNHEMNPARVPIKIQKSDPPTLDRPFKWSKEFPLFLQKCLVKNPENRAAASILLHEPFLRDVGLEEQKAIRVLICEAQADVVETIEDDVDPHTLRQSVIGDLDLPDDDEDDAVSRDGYSSRSSSPSMTPRSASRETLDRKKLGPSSLVEVKSTNDKEKPSLHIENGTSLISENKQETAEFEDRTPTNKFVDAPPMIDINDIPPPDESAIKTPTMPVSDIELPQNHPNNNVPIAKSLVDVPVAKTDEGVPTITAPVVEDVQIIAPPQPLLEDRKFDEPPAPQIVHPSAPATLRKVSTDKQPPPTLPKTTSPKHPRNSDAVTLRTRDVKSVTIDAGVIEEPRLEARSNIAKFEQILSGKGTSGDVDNRRSAAPGRVVSRFFEEEQRQSWQPPGKRSATQSSHQSSTISEYNESDLSSVLSSLIDQVILSETRIPSVPGVVFDLMQDIIDGTEVITPPPTPEPIEEETPVVTDIDSLLPNKPSPRPPSPVTVGGFGSVSVQVNQRNSSEINGHELPKRRISSENNVKHEIHEPPPESKASSEETSPSTVNLPRRNSFKAAIQDLSDELDGEIAKKARQPKSENGDVATEEDRSRIKPDRRKSHYRTMTKTRKFYVDGVEMTTSTIKVVRDGQEPKADAKFEERKRELRDLKLLVKGDQRQVRELSSKASLAIDQMEQKFRVEEAAMLRQYSLEMEKMMKDQKSVLEREETQKENEIKQATKRIRAQNTKEERAFRETSRQQLAQVKASFSNLPKEQKKEQVRLRKEQMEMEQSEKLRAFKEDLDTGLESELERMRFQYRQKVAQMERDFCHRRHEMRRNHESAHTAAKERHLRAVYQTKRSQLSDFFALKRQQTSQHLEHEQVQLQANIQRDEEILATAQARELRETPKKLKTLHRQRMTMFRKSLQINNCTPDEEKEKMRQFDEAEKARMRDESERVRRRHAHKQNELREKHTQKRRDLDQLHAERRKQLMDQEKDELKEMEDDFREEMARFKANVNDRRQQLEQELDQEMRQQDDFYRSTNPGTHQIEIRPLNAHGPITDVDTLHVRLSQPITDVDSLSPDTSNNVSSLI